MNKVETDFGYYFVPAVQTLYDIKAHKRDNGDITLSGRTDTGKRMTGLRQCEITIKQAKGCVKQYAFYTMKPDHKQITYPITIPRLINSATTRKLERQKGGNRKSKRPLVVKNTDVPIRSAITKRDPDQNTVMDQRAVNAYKECATQY